MKSNWNSFAFWLRNLSKGFSKAEGQALHVPSWKGHVSSVVFWAILMLLTAACGVRTISDGPRESRPASSGYTGAVTHQGRAYTNVLTDQELEKLAHRPSGEDLDIQTTVPRQFRVKGFRKIHGLLPAAEGLLEHAAAEGALHPHKFLVQMETQIQFPGASSVRLRFLSQGRSVFELFGDVLETDGQCAPFHSIDLAFKNHSVCLMGNDFSGRLVFRIQGESGESFWLDVRPQDTSDDLDPGSLLALSDLAIQIPEDRHQLLKFLESDLPRPEVRKWILELWPKDRRIPRFLKLYHEALAKKPVGEAAAMARMMAEIQGSEFPDALAFVPFAESNFKPSVTSPAGAHGYWQFMPATAQNYGLKIPTAENPSQKDQREDIVLSTRAALRKYREMATDFAWGSDFKMLMAAYNMGQWGLDKKVKQLDGKKPIAPSSQDWGEILSLQEAAEFSTDFWELHDAKMVPAETRKYVAKIVAALIMSMDPKLAEQQGSVPIDTH